MANIKSAMKRIDVIDRQTSENKSYKTIPTIIALFDSSGISSTNEDLRIQEHRTVLPSLFPQRVLSDYHTLLDGDTFEEKLYIVIKGHKHHKLFYMLNLGIIKLFALINKKSKWVREFPFKI